MNAFSDAIVVHDLLRRGGDVVTYADADAAGVPRAVVRRCAAQGDVIRVGKAAFVATERWQSASAWERFRLVSIGFAMSAGPGVFLTGHAAALVHAIPVDGSPPTVPTAVRPGNPHTGLSRSAHGRVRSGYLPLAHQQQRHRVGVVSPAYTVVDIARHGTPVAGLMAADHVLHRGLHRDIPRPSCVTCRHTPGSSKPDGFSDMLIHGANHRSKLSADTFLSGRVGQSRCPMSGSMGPASRAESITYFRSTAS